MLKWLAHLGEHRPCGRLRLLLLFGGLGGERRLRPPTHRQLLAARPFFRGRCCWQLVGGGGQAGPKGAAAGVTLAVRTRTISKRHDGRRSRVTAAAAAAAPARGACRGPLRRSRPPAAGVSRPCWRPGRRRAASTGRAYSHDSAGAERDCATETSIVTLVEHFSANRVGRRCPGAREIGRRRRRE